MAGPILMPPQKNPVTIGVRMKASKKPNKALSLHTKFTENMKMRFLLAITTAAWLLMGCANCPCRTRHWEYKTVSGQVLGNENTLTDAINREVSQGWEFVATGQAADHWGFAVLRRQKK